MSFEKKSEEFNALQREMSGLVATRQQLEAQLQENKIVQKEFDTLGDEKIYKLIGPVLVPQEKVEATTNVNKRLEFIQSEIKRVEARINTGQKKMEETRNEVTIITR
uniref:ARAD1B11198p n=1 Tax=Blastobotrys adeninivorans TaxID=409370 RepID=A0A060T5G8_BLAAD